LTARQRTYWTWGSISFVIFAAILGALVERATQKVADRIETRFGYEPSPEGTRKVLAEFGPEGFFSASGEDAIRKAEGKDTFLYRSAQKAHLALYGEPWVVGKQGIGDCTGWGWSHAIWVALCVDWETGRLANPPPMVATESIYGGSRVEGRSKDGSGRSAVGGWSDGSYGAAAARFVRDYGVAFRVKDGGHDLTTYSADRAKQWGAFGNGGANDLGKFDQFVKAHPAQHVAAIKDFSEAASAIESGFPVAVCSSVGFSNTRDKDGFSPATTTWQHCQVFISVRYKKNGSPDDGLLCLNSWGPSWISGPRWPNDMPEGSYWVHRSTVDRMLGGENTDSFAVGSVGGFSWRPVNHRDWFEPPPAAEPLKLEPATVSGVDRYLDVGPFQLAF
jgi:hypothetical protein